MDIEGYMYIRVVLLFFVHPLNCLLAPIPIPSPFSLFGRERGKEKGAVVTDQSRAGKESNVWYARLSLGFQPLFLVWEGEGGGKGSSGK